MGRIAGVIGIVAALLLSSCEPLAMKNTIMELSDPPTWELSQAPLMPGEGDDFFGYSVDMSDNYLIIGAYGSDEAAGTDNGAAYIYVRVKDGQWQFQKKIVSDSVADNDYFGATVAITDEYAVVASPGSTSIEIFERSAADWNPVIELGGAGPYFGSALDIHGIYVIAGDYGNAKATIYYRNADIWSFQQDINEPNALLNEKFGWSVSIHGDYAVVGDYQYAASNSGQAYVYQGDGSVWSLIDTIESNSPTADGDFGKAVSISSDQMVISEAGTAKIYFYSLSGTEWVLEDVNSVPGVAIPGDNFGDSLFVSDRVTVVGADGTDSGTGTAYVFEKYDNDWVYKAPPLFYSKNEAGDSYGQSVATNGINAVIGADYDDNASGTDSGSAYLFIRE